LLLLFKISLADDVHLKDGSVFRNVQVIDTLANSLRCRTAFGFSVQIIPLNTIDRIVFSPYDANRASVFEDATVQRGVAQKPLQQSSTTISSAKFLLPIGLLSFLLSWDYLSDASDLRKTMDNLKTANVNADVSSLEASKDRKEMIGFTCAVIGVMAIVFSLQDLEISGNSNEIRLSYRFHH
jgi:hypothetical protein